MLDPKVIFLTVSIVNYDSDERELKAVLGSLLVSLSNLTNAGYRCQTQVVFIDNSEENKLTLAVFNEFDARLRELSIELSLLQGHGNIGYGRGHNLAILSDLANSANQASKTIPTIPAMGANITVPAIPHSDSNYHLILNPDVELAADCLSEGIHYLENNLHVAIASPAATDRDGKKQHLCRRYPAVITLLIRGFFPRPMRRFFQQRLATDEMHELPQDRPTEGIWIVSGCFMLCQTKYLLAVSGFDSKYFMYFEDFDLSLRIGKIARLAYVPSMKIKHFGGNAAGKGIKHIVLFIRSGCRFFNTHGWRVIR